MTRKKPRAIAPHETAESAAWRREAMQNWENEGGSDTAVAVLPRTARVTDAEIAQLRMRVVALEGVVLALLAQGSGPQRQAAAEMAAHIRPRPGRTPHPLTLRAAARITQLVARARAVRVATTSSDPAAAGRTPP
jgi:hypothetical protein